MLHMVGRQFALATGYTVAPDDALRQQFEGAGQTFESWLQIGWQAGGTDDRTILGNVQTNYGTFESSARAMMAAADLSARSRVTFAEAAGAVNTSLGSYLSTVNGEVAAARESSAAAVSGAQTNILFITFAGIALAIGLGFWFAGTITGPIRRLRDVADKVSTGEVENVEIDVNTKDEIADLADSFRRMVASVKFLMMRGDDDEDEDDGFDFGKKVAS
jgi:HAMP domain-containing protein